MGVNDSHFFIIFVQAMNIIFKFLSLVLVFSLVACNPSYEQAKKKHQRLIELYPELIERDTVTITDTIVTEKEVIVPEYRDSFVIQYDTIIETKKVIIEKRGNSFGIIVKPDTLTLTDTITHTVTVPGKIVTVTEINWMYVVVAFILGILTLAFVMKR